MHLGEHVQCIQGVRALSTYWPIGDLLTPSWLLRSRPGSFLGRKILVCLLSKRILPSSRSSMMFLRMGNETCVFLNNMETLMSTLNYYPQQLMTRTEAANLLRIKPHTLACWQCQKRNDLPVVKVGRLAMYRPQDIEAFIQVNLGKGA